MQLVFGLQGILDVFDLNNLDTLFILGIYFIRQWTDKRPLDVYHVI